MPIHELILTDTWFIGRSSDNQIIHYGFCQTETRLDSGQEIIELFNDENSYIKRLVELGIDLESETL